MTPDLMLVAKIVVFVFIVTSPFYDGAKVFSFATNDLVKLLLLLVVIGLAFVDLQLAILAAIAFFIILIATLPNVAGPKEVAVQLPPKQEFIPPVIYQEPEESCDVVEDREEDEPVYHDVPQTMFEFPDVRCEVPIEASDAYINETINNHYLDEKIKPYEQYIAQLTNKELLESVSNAAYLMPEEAL